MNSESVPIVVGVEADGAEESCRAFADVDAVGANFERHAAERGVHAVLHVNRRQIGIAADLERHVDLAKPAVRAGRGHVEHALDAVDHRFERCRDGAFDRLRVRAGIERADRNCRRGELRDNGRSAASESQSRPRE